MWFHILNTRIKVWVCGAFFEVFISIIQQLVMWVFSIYYKFVLSWCSLLELWWDCFFIKVQCKNLIFTWQSFFFLVFLMFKIFTSNKKQLHFSMLKTYLIIFFKTYILNLQLFMLFKFFISFIVKYAKTIFFFKASTYFHSHAPLTPQ